MPEQPPAPPPSRIPWPKQRPLATPAPAPDAAASSLYSVLRGKRTFIALTISGTLKLFVAHNLVDAENATPENVDLVTDALILLVSCIADIAAAYFRWRASASPNAPLVTPESPVSPGPVAPREGGA